MEAGDGRIGVEAGSRRVRLFTVAVLVLLTLVTGVLIGRTTAPAEAAPTPSSTSAEAGFARDMQAHHNQAVEMAILIRDRSDDDELRLLALDIITAQSQQAGQMYALLTAWNLPQTSSDPPMAWMSQPTLDGSMTGMDHGGGAMASTEMPGMASSEDVQRLRDADGVEAERIFLELMIAHHRGGMDMAEALLARSDNALIAPLAQSIVMLQQKEIDYMTKLLAERS